MRLGTSRAARRPLTCALIVACAGAIGTGAASAADSVWPRLKSPLPRDAQMEARISQIVAHMTLEQKVAQMVQADIRSVTADDVKQYRLGSVLNGGGAWPANNKHATVADWVALADDFYDASMDTSGGAQAIPIMWGTDAVHGHNNVIGATLFPQNIGLGAAHDPKLIERIGEATASEVIATGIDWTFAPTVAVVRDDRWGRTYESYSEDPQIVRTYATRMVRGLQGTPRTSSFLDSQHIVASAKHFIGDGGTGGTDRGNNCSSERELRDIHAPGYLAALGAGVQTVMVSYNSWQGEQLHGDRHLLTEVLKERLGFDGVVVSDWNGIDQVSSCSKDRCARAVNAGIDLLMVPDDWKAFIGNTVAQARAGDIPESRINDAVTRILRVKMRAGLFDKGRPSTRPGVRPEAIGAPEHRALAREAVRKSLVLLKNKDGVLPLRPNMKVLVAGAGANDIGKQAGGWTLTWQGDGNTNADFPGATSIFEGVRAAVTAAGGTATLSVDGSFESKPDVAVVVFGESPYAEWHGDLRSIAFEEDIPLAVDVLRPAPEPNPLGYPPSLQCGRAQAGSAPPVEQKHAPRRERALLQALKQRGIPIVAVLLAGRPLWITPELDLADAFVVAWLPGSEGAGVADVLFRKSNGQVNFDFTGRLSFSWPRAATQSALNRGDARYAPLFSYGYGLSYCNAGCERSSSAPP
jgi:beta-glucosidase